MAIIAQIQGGLGNQLFQYAAARSLSCHYKTNLLLDSAWYKGPFEDVTPRTFLLNHFSIEAEIISLKEPMRSPRRLRRLLQEYFPTNPFIAKEKKHYVFDSHLMRLPLINRRNVYLMGYWQSYKYFQNIHPLLQKELLPIEGLDKHHQTYLNAINDGSSTMLHVRRGDYVQLRSAAEIHNVVDLNYYQRAMRYALERDPSTRFFVFSDDLQWAKSHLPYTERLVLIEPQLRGDDVIQELVLMRSCQNHIIANSSLSWWGAWLADQSSGFVLTPSRWISDLAMSVEDLLPRQWIRL